MVEMIEMVEMTEMVKIIEMKWLIMIKRSRRCLRALYVFRLLHSILLKLRRLHYEECTMTKAQDSVIDSAV
jgi:hypothetical protein